MREAQHREKLAKKELKRFEESIKQKCKEIAEFGIKYEDMKQQFETNLIERKREIHELSERSEKLEAKLRTIQEQLDSERERMKEERQTCAVNACKAQKMAERKAKELETIQVKEMEHFRSFVRFF